MEYERSLRKVRGKPDAMKYTRHQKPLVITLFDIKIKILKHL